MFHFCHVKRLCETASFYRWGDHMLDIGKVICNISVSTLNLRTAENFSCNEIYTEVLPIALLAYHSITLTTA